MISHSPLLQHIIARVEANPEKTAIVSCSGEEISYAEMWDNILKWCGFARSQRLTAGNRVMLSAQKDVEFVYAYLGNHLLGIVNVVVDALNSKEHLEYIAQKTNPVLCVGCEIEGLNSINFSEINMDDYAAEGVTAFPSIKEDSVADIMFTSGTTGKPKGVLLTHANIFGSAQNINGFIGNSSEDIELLALPICHSFGLGRLRCNLINGATVILHNGFANLKSVFSTIEKYGVTGFGMVPAVWAYIKRFSGERIGKYAEQIRYIEIGSAAMQIDDKEMLMRLFPNTRICMHYGLTEASRSLFMEFHEEKGDLSTIGRPVSDCVEVVIMSEDGQLLGDAESGEICVRGNMVAASYLDSEDNENAYFGEYFRTGDGGRKDGNGKFYLESRIKELINVGGKKVSPVEIEDVLEKLGVGECMCVAMPDPKGVLGEVPKVLIQKGAYAGEISDLKNLLKGKIEEYKMPQEFEIVDKIPKTANGKKQRNVRN